MLDRVGMVIEIDGAFYRISKPSFEMLIPRWEGYAPETADQADATITLSDGTRRSATFMTFGVVSKIMDRWRDTGECLSGRYFWCSDLVVIREPGFDSMIAAVQDMIATGEIDDAYGVLPPLDEEAMDQ
ncbi:hypothetical protein EDD27_9801 [Nonomuraea polychroma]|uniref:Uncharacterized protein n=1 Tax=Nonomuraea polychroma TaxID=46176 RepID=A0A438MMG1_9ACTN|nr:hypothetical protein [Nonomuraea polychroma]RVX46888.1 hypothetical protein EDD27_9801 [Nonomuraea polychroma]